eukprot:4836727-Ditylum_brightwellii.AAC.1
MSNYPMLLCYPHISLASGANPSGNSARELEEMGSLMPQLQGHEGGAGHQHNQIQCTGNRDRAVKAPSTDNL